MGLGIDQESNHSPKVLEVSRDRESGLGWRS